MSCYIFWLHRLCLTLAGKPQTWWMPRLQQTRWLQDDGYSSRIRGVPMTRPNDSNQEVKKLTPKTISFGLPLWEVLWGVFRSKGFRILNIQNNKIQAHHLFPKKEGRQECVGLIEVISECIEKRREPLSLCTTLHIIRCVIDFDKWFVLKWKFRNGELQDDSPLARPPVTIQRIK